MVANIEQGGIPLIWSLPLPILLEKVLPFACTKENLGTVFSVCRQFNLAARSQRFWRALTLATYELDNQKVPPAQQKLRLPPAHKEWKWLFMSKREFVGEKFTGLGSKKIMDPPTSTSSTTYEGEWKEGVKNGFGVLYYDNGVRYEGEYLDSKKHGKGKLYYSQGDFYDGDFVCDKKTGKGTYIWANGDKYKGEFIDDKTSGFGEFSWADGDTYSGNFLNDSREGNGVYRWTNGDTYTGEYKNGSRTGSGTYLYWNGNKYQGGFKSNLFDGEGTFIEFTGWKINLFWEAGIPEKFISGEKIVKFNRADLEEGDLCYGVAKQLLELLNPNLVKAIKQGKCTYSVTGNRNYGQFLFKTKDRGDRTHGLCIVCASTCAPKNGRKLSVQYVFGGNFICDCGLGFESEFPCHSHAKDTNSD